MDSIIIISMIAIQLILAVVAMVDLNRRDKSEIIGENKLIWGLVILFITTIGAIVYLTAGKKSIGKSAR